MTTEFILGAIVTIFGIGFMLGLLFWSVKIEEDLEHKPKNKHE
jgi:hypothetical protein